MVHNRLAIKAHLDLLDLDSLYVFQINQDPSPGCSDLINFLNYDKPKFSYVIENKVLWTSVFLFDRNDFKYI